MARAMRACTWLVDANTSLVSTRFTHTNSFFSPPGALSIDDAGDVAVRAAGSSGGAFLIPANNAITPYFSSNSLQELASQSTFTGSLDAAGNLYVAYEEFTDSVASITLFKFSDQTTSAPRIGADFDGDGRSELVAYTPSTGQWLSLDSSTLYTTRHEFDPQFWGAPGDVPVLGDYDGDNRLDYAVYRPSTGAWYFIPSRTRVGVGYTWGAVGDVPVPGDYDGHADGRFNRPCQHHAGWREPARHVGIPREIPRVVRVMEEAGRDVGEEQRRQSRR